MAKMEKNEMKSQTKPVKSQRPTSKCLHSNRCGDDICKAQDKNDTFTKSWKKLKDCYGLIYVCNGCGNVLDSEGYTLDEGEMGNNYSYILINGKTYHWAICDKCKSIVLLGKI